MALGLSGEEYLQDQGPAYGTPGNPAQAPAVEGGWGGVLLAGVSALAGIASDNPYAVAFGSGMGQSYADSYDTLNKSLVEEQRANRLADASLARQKHLATFNYDLGAEDREAALLEDKRRYDQDFGLRTEQEKRLGKQEQRQGALHNVQMQTANLALSAAQHEQRMRTDTEYAKVHMKQQAELEGMVNQLKMNQSAEATKQQLDSTITQIEASDLPTAVKERLKYTAQVQAIFPNTKASDILKTGGASVKPEDLKVVYNQSLKMNKESETYQTMVADPNIGQAGADKWAISQANIETQNFAVLSQQFGGAGGLFEGSGGGGNAIAGMVGALTDGSETPESLLEQAENEAEVAAANAAIEQYNATQVGDNDEQEVQLYSGGGQPSPEFSAAVQMEQPASDRPPGYPIQNLPSQFDPDQLDTSYRRRGALSTR